MLVHRLLHDQTRSAYLWTSTCAEDCGYPVTPILSAVDRSVAHELVA